MGATVAGKQFKNLSGTVGTSSVATISAGSIRGIFFLQNPHPTAVLYVGLSGETPDATAKIGMALGPRAGIILTDDDVPAANDVLLISDTVSTPYTAYTIG